jgi:hypothetical protein
MEGKEDNLSKKLGRFWRTLFLTETGRPKSTVILYSFTLSFAFMAIYALAYGFMVKPIDEALKGLSVTWRNVLESVIPGLSGSIVCCGISLLIKERIIPAGAYIWHVVFVVIFLVAMIAEDAEVYRFFLYFILLYVPVGLLTGTIFTHHRYGVYRRAKIKKEREIAEKEREKELSKW